MTKNILRIDIKIMKSNYQICYPLYPRNPKNLNRHNREVLLLALSYLESKLTNMKF